MKLQAYVNFLELRRLVDAGFVSVREHNELPLRIYNYTPKATSIRAHEWPDALKKARGLIVDDLNDVVAFGLQKFFNYTDEDYRDEPFYVNEKMDGSLGIVFKYFDKVHIATRGSFHSKQAEWANEFLASHPDHVKWFENSLEFEPWNTPHVEIIYKNNRVVVDYDYDDLVLLGFQSDERWVPATLWANEYPSRVAQPYHFDSFSDMARNEVPNAEGYVIQFENGSLFKYKFERYLELHRVVSDMNARTIFNRIAEGNCDEFIEQLPNEFQDEARAIQTELVELINSHRNELNTYWKFLVNFLDNELDRKRIAFLMRDQGVPKWVQTCVFCKLDSNEKGITDVILKKIKP